MRKKIIDPTKIHNFLQESDQGEVGPICFDPGHLEQSDDPSWHGFWSTFHKLYLL